MITLHMLVDESYIDEFVQSLPRDKVRLIEENFKENKALLEDALEKYKKGENGFHPFEKSVQNMNEWLKGRQK